MDNSKDSHQESSVPSDPLIDAEQYLQCMDQHVKALSIAVDGCKNSLSSVGSNYRGWIDAYRGEVQRNHFRGQENNFLQDQARHMTAEIRNLKASNKQLCDEVDSAKHTQPRAKTERLELLVKQYETGMSSLHKRATDLESEKAILAERLKAAEKSLRDMERELDNSRYEQLF